MSEEILKQYWDAYPNEKVLLATSDGQVFLQKNANDATNHQLRVDSTQKVKPYYRDKVEEGTNETGDDQDGLTPDESWTKEEIVAWLAVANVEAEVKEKKDDLLAKVKEVLASEEEEGEEGETGDNNPDGKAPDGSEGAE